MQEVDMHEHRRASIINLSWVKSICPLAPVFDETCEPNLISECCFETIHTYHFNPYSSHSFFCHFRWYDEMHLLTGCHMTDSVSNSPSSSCASSQGVPHLHCLLSHIMYQNFILINFYNHTQLYHHTQLLPP